jgi:hypothetical protein
MYPGFVSKSSNVRVDLSYPGSGRIPVAPHKHVFFELRTLARSDIKLRLIAADRILDLSGLQNEDTWCHYILCRKSASTYVHHCPDVTFKHIFFLSDEIFSA